MDRIEVRVLSIVPGPQGQSLILGEEDGQRYLPVVIGIPEALAIYFELQQRTFDRPMTHDLLARMLDALDARLTSVTITELRDGTFHAELNITQEGRERSIDSRSSDAIALALRAHVPIYVAAEVMEQAGQWMEPETTSPDSPVLEEWAAEELEEEDGPFAPGTREDSEEPLEADDRWDRFREIMRDAGLDEDNPQG
jgi:uncharacterized protein